MIGINKNEMVIADLYDERSDIAFTVSALSLEELQDIISYHKTIRLETVYYDKYLNDN